MTPMINALIGAWFGALFGSFLTVVTSRGAQSVVEDGRVSAFWRALVPNSACPSCGHALRWWDLIPILSFLFLKGRCGKCSLPIPSRYLWLEIVTAAGWAVLFFAYGIGPDAIFGAFFFTSLLAISEIDRRVAYIPDALTLPMIVLGIVVCSLSNTHDQYSFIVGGARSMLAASLGYVVPYLFALIYAAIRKRSIDDVFGGGDAKLLAMIGAWLGAWALMPVAFFGFTLFAIVNLARGAGRMEAAPLGPWIASGAVAVLVPEVQQLIGIAGGGILAPLVPSPAFLDHAIFWLSWLPNP